MIQCLRVTARLSIDTLVFVHNKTAHLRYKEEYNVWNHIVFQDISLKCNFMFTNAKLHRKLGGFLGQHPELET